MSRQSLSSQQLLECFINHFSISIAQDTIQTRLLILPKITELLKSLEMLPTKNKKSR
jgi:hypothetical protein